MARTRRSPTEQPVNTNDAFRGNASTNEIHGHSVFGAIAVDGRRARTCAQEFFRNRLSETPSNHSAKLRQAFWSCSTRTTSGGEGEGRCGGAGEEGQLGALLEETIISQVVATRVFSDAILINHGRRESAMAPASIAQGRRPWSSMATFPIHHDRYTLSGYLLDTLLCST